MPLCLGSLTTEPPAGFFLDARPTSIKSQRVRSTCCRARRKRQAAPELELSRPKGRTKHDDATVTRPKPAVIEEVPTLSLQALDDDFDDNHPFAEDEYQEVVAGSFGGVDSTWPDEDLGEDSDDDDLEWEQGTVISEETLFDVDSGWSVSAIPDRAPRTSASRKNASGLQQVVRDPDKDLSRQSAFQGVPMHVVRKLQTAQDEADAMNSRLKANARRKTQAAAKTHKRLRIISGAFAGKTLLSGQGESTRPMMEKVRAAVFDMLLAITTGTNTLPPDSRWLDLFAGTGSVGLEALSRGAAAAHFVELDPWVSSNILQANILACSRQAESTVFGGRAESFLERVAAVPHSAPAPYDFISVCPPYLQVSYPELFQLLETSPLIKASTFIVVEYPRLLQHEMPPSVGPLERLTSRKYGRTYVAVYGPHDSER